MQKASLFFRLNFWAILSIFLIFIVFFFLNERIRAIRDKLWGIERKQKEERIRVYSSTSHSPAQSAQIPTRLIEQLKKIEEKIYSLEVTSKARDSQTTLGVENPNEVIFHVDNEIKPKTDENIAFYMATPDKDGFFNITSQYNSFKPGTTFYRLCLNTKDNDRANFDFHSDEYGIKVCANYPQTYLDPVCEPVNTENPNAKKISTIEKGKVEKRSDRWVVTQKAKIRYE